jgi:hypothetical protein
MLNENKLKLKSFICNLFLTLFFITHIYYEFNISQHKNFLHSTQQKLTNHVFYTKLHMHEIQLHAPIPSLYPTLNQLTAARETQFCITSMNSVTPFELTSTTILNEIQYHRFGNRLVSSIRNRSRLTTLETADLTTSDSISTPLSQPKPIMLDVPAPTLDKPASNPSTMLDMPALRLSSCCIGLSKCAPNYSRNCATSNLRSILDDTTTLDAPKRTLLEPAPTALDVPATPILTAQAVLRLLHSTPPSLDFLLANPHDPGPQDSLNKVLRFSLSLYVFIIAISINAPSLAFSTTAKFATYDYLLIPPRSPQCIYVLCFL